MNNTPRLLLSIALLLAATLPSSAQEKKALTVSDMMKFRQISSPVISDDGEWVAYTAIPDRGDPEVVVRSSAGRTEFIMKQAEKPAISGNSIWVAAVKTVPAGEAMKAKKDKKPKTGLILLNTSTGNQKSIDSVQAFQFSNDSRWLLYHHFHDSTLVLNSLQGKDSVVYSRVTKFAIDSISRYLAYVVEDTGSVENGLYITDLRVLSGEPVRVYVDSNAWAGDLTWNKQTGQLAFLAGITGKKGLKQETSLHLWSPENGDVKALEDSALYEGWKIHHTNHLEWSKDGLRLFLGIKPESELVPPEEEADSAPPLYHLEGILAERGVDVWHRNDPYIIPHQKKLWKKEKDRIYTGVYHVSDQRFIALADKEMPEVDVGTGHTLLLGSSGLPYAQRATWDGSFKDYFLVRTDSCGKRQILEEQEHTVKISPDGKFVVYYRERQWYLLNTATLEVRSLTDNLDVPFADEDWDYPADVPGYGTGGWLDGSSAVLIYDKYDIWLFPTNGDEALCLTEGRGRKELYQFRIRKLDKEKAHLVSEETVYLSAYHDQKKHTALYSMEAGLPGVHTIFEAQKKYSLVAKAKEAEKFIFTRQSYTEFPDLWVSDLKFKKPVRITDVNPQVKEFAWGVTELVEWSSVDGTPLQGILIKPENAEPGKKHPVLVFYYRFFTNRLYDFNHVAVSHRPCFPFYASNGYAIFLPDIRFDVGTPGYSATKCLVPGVQKLIDMGVADPGAICLHGHSWSGYQTAFAITQTDIFTCAIAGAPVSNMTSAYNGIRWKSGLARQFQYEKTQSRIGGSLWDVRDKYIENSPVFFADRIATPLLIQFGDEDGAVPWYQGIELYLAMRRLGKDCIFLQYRGEGHHLKQYANKLDYTLKFKEYLDHYLKGEPAANWIKEGVPYTGK
ncbi:MAG: S9 family peptidase [Bacteroidetes bacterium]|nr:S9 family peptidase [Bacteroidota bacterium]